MPRWINISLPDKTPLRSQRHITTNIPQYSSVKPKNLGKDAKFRVSTGLKLVPKILN
ncbi:hypothetical protein [Nostoc sphaeroides]|uniref:Uncharacterized protein n=1 Tax=Nostoc sphaeroides CCNUC1 TaxID=2653204 RepID=A0A5P8VT61_9NOSO|nr:hypothetical protein [Nostoc sphaeroides]MCC5628335.1 hypothetical protein [Nostoc sphaeroides CHAB 2801]QFS43557.1 hypothetical protein GXM_01030 [Nostoc sphaeroides CCNUC1]